MTTIFDDLAWISASEWLFFALGASFGFLVGALVAVISTR